VTVLHEEFKLFLVSCIESLSHVGELYLLSFNALPGGMANADGSYSWGIGSLRLTTTDRSFIDSWANWNFEGYEGLAETASGVEQYRKSYPEYHDLMLTMDSLSRQRGCGRAHLARA